MSHVNESLLQSWLLVHKWSNLMIIFVLCMRPAVAGILQSSHTRLLLPQHCSILVMLQASLFLAGHAPE